MPSRRTTIFRSLPAAAIFAAAMPLAVAAEPPEIAPLTGQLLIAAPTTAISVSAVAVPGPLTVAYLTSATVLGEDCQSLSTATPRKITQN